MKIKCLRAKVWIICLLRHYKIIKNVWYQSELDLAALRAKDYAEFFSKRDTAHINKKQSAVE